jgi:type 1 glutamine amidotransferase
VDGSGTLPSANADPIARNASSPSIRSEEIMTTRFTTLIAALIAAVTLALCPTTRADDAVKGSATRPLRALLISGGCCHDYKNQNKIIPEGVSARARVEWTIVLENGPNDHKVSTYDIPDWSEGFDLVVHNECFSQVSDPVFIEKVLSAHRSGVPAMVIHCSMHTFRDLKTDAWREFLGVTTRRHGPQQPLEVKNLVATNPIMKTFPAVWTTGNEELYAIEKVWPSATPLAQAYALDNKRDHPVIWTNTYGKGRVFGTTLAHNNKTVGDTVYLDMLTRGLLWACGKLDEEGNPKPGYAAGK